MRLKSLELQGFKSFPDKTVLNFDDGITIIIGPNGSGKSNISDAVRWVLGEISSKNIRGTKMEDVIFGGTDFRSQMSFAEVSLTIDNASEDENRIPIDYDEVTVTRRYNRGGDSEYYINRRPARLRDITELFLNTGIGKTGYSIIGQGKIAEILSQRSEDRRNIFEEASGIAKYRYKKEEAEHKLEDVEANILRINDIRAELEQRLKPLEEESKKARQYLEIYEEKKKADISLWLYDISQTKGKVNEAEQRYTLLKNELDIADDTLSALETQNEKLYLTTQENKLKVETAARMMRESRENKYSLESNQKVLENEISHIETQIENYETDIAAAQKKREESEIKHSENKEEYAKLENLTEKDGKRLLELEDAAKNIETEYEQIRDRIDAQNKAIDLIGNRIVDAKLRRSSLEGSRESANERMKKLEDEIKKLSKESDNFKDRIDTAEKAIADYNITKGDMQNQLDLLESERSSIGQSFDELTKKINELKLEMSSKRQRADTMRRMEELFEGYQSSVRFVMNMSEKGRLNGIYGPVSKLISVKGRYSTAIETALGANIQNIVVENEESAKKAMALLKVQNAGRATFYPLTSIKNQPLNMNKADMQAYAGYIGIASELAEHDMKFDNIIVYMLGRTVVFDNIDNAAVMAKATGYRVRLVTLDGQLINAGGSFTGGSVKKDTGMLTRAADIEKFENEIIRLQREIKLEQENLEKSKNEISEIENKKADIFGKYKLIDSLLQAENTQLQVLVSQCEANDASLKGLKKELDSFSEKNYNIESEYDSLDKTIAEAEVNLSTEKKSLEKLESESRDSYDRLTDNHNVQNALKLSLAEQKKDLEAKRSAIKLEEESLTTLAEQIEKYEQALYVLNEKLISEQNTITENGEKLKNIDNDIIKLEEEQKKLLLLTEQDEKKSLELRDLIREKTHKRENVFKDYAKAESECKLLLSEQDKLTEKLWEEYELTYSSASALGYPTITAEKRDGISAEQLHLRNKLRALGSVNTGAIEEFKTVSERYEFISVQLNDLNASRSDFSDIVFKLEDEMRNRFSTTFEEINFHFGRIFSELFGGGNAELRLTDPENILECGIEINVAPPGKIIKSLSLLSGGEQAFVAITLLFAILKVNPTPFCLLDEIEAALDDSNVRRFTDYLRNYSDSIQFIIITHRRGTMEAANTLYGVTMYERGISKVLSVNIDEAEEKLLAGLSIDEQQVNSERK